MRHDDYVGIAGATAFGLWFVVFPKSVIRFYCWFLPRQFWRPVQEPQVRRAGVFWLALVLTVSYLELR